MKALDRRESRSRIVEDDNGDEDETDKEPGRTTTSIVLNINICTEHWRELIKLQNKYNHCYEI